jgi:hypothetical protein
MCIDALCRRELAKGACHLYIQQVRNDKRVTAGGQVTPYRVG